jgi:baseplate J-like protein
MTMADPTSPSATLPQIDYLARDYASLLKAMTDLIPFKLPEWTGFQSPADFGTVLLQLFAHMGDILSYYQDRVVSESFLSTATSRRSVIQHLRLIGYVLGTASPAAARLTLSMPAVFAGNLTIKRGDAFATKSQSKTPSVRFEYNGASNLTLDFSAVPVDATGRKRLVDVLPVEEGRLARDEVLGVSDGKPRQRLRLAHPRLVLRTLGTVAAIAADLAVVSQLGMVITPWSLQDSLAFSRADRTDYTVEIDEDDQATILFGDGAFGAIPPVGSEIRATYRYGGGAAGNVAAGSIQSIVDAPALALLGARVTNLAAATGGADRESLEHAVLQAPSVFRSLRRAVTAEDYRALALAFPGVGKVRAEGAGANLVRLFVAPSGGGQVSDLLRSNLLAYFEDKRPVSTLIDIQSADYVRIYVTARIQIGAYFSRTEVSQLAADAAARLLAFDEVDFARTVYLSKFYEALEAIDGIDFVNVTEFRSERDAPDTVNALGKIELGSNEIAKAPDDPVADIPYLSGVKLVVDGGF